jgi:hypothetical protein
MSDVLDPVYWYDNIAGPVRASLGMLYGQSGLVHTVFCVSLIERWQRIETLSTGIFLFRK